MNTEPKPKVKNIKFSTSIKGLYLEVEGEPELVRQALQECLNLVVPKPTPEQSA